MEINQLRYVLKVSKYRNFSRAADELYISQPALSQQISKLEQELGLVLFRRTTRTVSLTGAGEDFVAQAQKIVDSWEELHDVMQKHFALEKGRIVIGVLPTIGELNLTHYIAGFLQCYSNIKIELVEDWSDNLMAKLLNNEIDVAFLNIVLPSLSVLNDIEYYPLIEDRVILITNQNSSIAHKSSATMEELAYMPVLMLKDHTSMTKIIQAELKRYNINPPVVCECSNVNTLVSMITEGMGVSFLTSKVAAQYTNARIKLIPIQPEIKTYTALALVSSKNHAPITIAFKNFIIQQIKQAYPS